MMVRSFQGVADFTRLPESEISACLRVFRAWISEQKAMKAEAHANGRPFSISDEFVWRVKGEPKKRQIVVAADTSVRELGLGPGAVYAFLEMKLLLLEDFSAVEAQELARIKNVGQTTVRKVREMLRSIGLDFLPPADERQRVALRAKEIRDGQAAGEITDDQHVVELGIKGAALTRLHDKKISTIGQLRNTSPRDLYLMFGTAGVQHVMGRLMATGLHLRPVPSRLELWQYSLVPVDALERPANDEPVEELAPWLGPIPAAARKAGIESVGALAEIARGPQKRLKGVGDHGWRRLYAYFGVPTHGSKLLTAQLHDGRKSKEG